MLKLFNIFTCVLYLVPCFGQSKKSDILIFKRERLDTLEIKSNLSFYQFDEQGTTKSTSNFLVITHSVAQKEYVINSYLKVKSTSISQPDYIITNCVKRKKANGSVVENYKLARLLSALAENENPEKMLSSLKKHEFEDLVNKHSILRIAKNNDIDWQFKRKYSNKADNRKLFKDFQSLDTLKIYLEERFDTNGYAMVTDYSNTIWITIKTQNAEYRYEGKYPNPAKQPWYEISDTLLFPKNVLNLNINEALTDILPDNFLNRSTISMQALMDDYIEWYLRRRNILF